MESWCDKVRREHPWWWRWTAFKDALQRAWDWLLDKPYWHQEDNDMVLRTLRTKQLKEE